MIKYPDTRKKAMAVKSSFYFTGKPCNKGHIEKRYTTTGQCPSCVREHSKIWKEKNSDWFPQYQRDKAIERHWENRSEIIEKTKQWRLKNPEKQKQLNKNWRKRNPESFRIYQSTRRARIKNAGGKFYISDIREMLKTQNQSCNYCNCFIGEKYHIDHIVPISKGGSNYIENIQLLCVYCNQSKYNKMPEEFLREINKKEVE